VLFVLVLSDDVGVQGTLDGAAAENTVAHAHYVAGDASSDLLGLTHVGLIDPVGVTDKSSANGDEIRTLVSQDFVGKFGIPDVADGNCGEVEPLLDFFTEIDL
jgi:hypothetical protein